MIATVNIFRGTDTPSRPADPATFVGSARVKLLGSSDEAVAVRVYEVAFEPGARTNWHRHSGPQWLLVIAGRIRIQTESATAQDVEAGDAVVIPPGEKHWHGAAPGGHGVHLAVNVDAVTDWLEPVSDADYDPAYDAEI
jgi:quercetin dioxygenase-like cupin family protein